MASEKTVNAGAYCRLSVDDGAQADSTNPRSESLSIENQKLLLQNYVREQGWNLVETYVDDGYSGTSL